MLLDRISVGGMAEVFKAKSYGVEGFEKVIAIKRILPSMGDDRDFITMFIDEAKIAGQLAHANICQIFELGRIDGAHFIAMEYIWGKDLLQIQNRLKKNEQPMPVPMACFVVGKACEGLDYAHRKRDPMGVPLEIVHRDCSPQNVLVSYEGEVKVIDFGIAKAASRSSRTMAGVLKGKFGYMSPEQVRGLPLDHRSDIFALGTILYESLVGERLFQGDSDFATLEKVRNAEIPSPCVRRPDIPPAVEAIVMRALEREPDDRYQHASEMHADLQAFLMSWQEVFTAKSLGQWLKQAFSGELSRERKLMETYKRLGRDGLISGEPHVKPDTLEHLAIASAAQSGPTALAAPAFAHEAEAAPRSRVRRSTSHGDADFGDEAPTEIFGEIDESDLISLDTIDQPIDDQPSVVTALPTADDVETIEGGGVPEAPMVMFTPRGMPALSASEAGASGPAGAMLASLGGDLPRRDPYLFGTTSSVTPLPSPYRSASARAPSIIKDVAIGVGIAVLVLAVFAVGKLVFFGSSSDANKSAIADTGTVVVTVSDEKSAEVYVNGEKRGVIEDGALTLEELPAGRYAVSVRRAGALRCDRDVALEARKVRHIKCVFARPPAVGTLVLTEMTDDHAVIVDGRRLSAAEARAPIALDANLEHRIVVEVGGQRVQKLELRVEQGETIRRAVVAAPTRAGGDRDEDERRRGRQEREASDRGEPRDRDETRERTPPSERGTQSIAESTEPAEPQPQVGHLLAYTTPWARVFIDGRDTGKMTPIAPRAKIALPAGRHRVTFVVGRAKFHYTVDIAPGRDTKLVEDLPVDSGG